MIKKFTQLYKNKNCLLSQKLFLEGKSYKISRKNTIWNLRFNTSNKTILILKNISIYNKGGQKKLYSLNQNLSTTPISKILTKVRPINTYTLRGLWSSNLVIKKRAGRVSEYM